MIKSDIIYEDGNHLRLDINDWNIHINDEYLSLNKYKRLKREVVIESSLK